MKEFRDQIEEIIDRVKNLPVVGIYLYGSWSRGEEDEFSDFDLMIVVENSEVKEEIKGLFQGMDINVFSERDLERYLELMPSFIVALREAVTLYGKPVEMLEIPEPDPVAMLAELRTGMERMDQLSELISDDVDETLTNTVVYVAILRLRQAFAVECLYWNRGFTKERFLRLIDEIGIGREYYHYYKLAKDDRLSLILTRGELKKLIESAGRYIEETFNRIAEDVVKRGEF